MKTRQAFVANSSSSSFVVIGNSGDFVVNRESGDTFVIGMYGETEFGWDHTVYDNMYDRINFAYLQTTYVNRPDWVEMLHNCLKKFFGVEHIDCVISQSWKIENGMVWGYIDHQSSACEGENVEIFENEDVLYRFLFDVGSYIQGDNDNR